MQRETLKDGLYGGFAQIIKNPKIYYNSMVGSDYNKFTEKGKEEILAWISDQARMISKNEEALREQEARDLVLKELKK